MNRNNLKIFILLLFAIFILTIMNGIVYYSFYFFIDWYNSKDALYMSQDNIDIICRIVVAIFALLSYWQIGKKIFSKINTEKGKKRITIILGVMIAISYPLSAQFSISYGLFYDIYWSMCSPIAYVLLLPLLFKEHTTPLLSEMLLTIFSPISVVLIWLFSKIKTRKKPDNIEDEYLS